MAHGCPELMHAGCDYAGSTTAVQKASQSVTSGSDAAAVSAQRGGAAALCRVDA